MKAKFQSISQLLYVGSLSLAVASCGGGQTATTVVTPVANIVPVANAGENQTINEQTTVTLVGNGSDQDGSISHYSWSQSSGTQVQLEGATTGIASFMAPDINLTQTMTFELTVTDNDGAVHVDSVDVIVSRVNSLPIANITSSDGFSAIGLNQFMLDGAESNDADGQITSYQWLQTSGTVVTLVEVNSSTLQFTPDNIDGALGFELTVTDDSGDSSTAEVTVVVQPYFKTLSGGGEHYCSIVATTSGDDVYCWGGSKYDLQDTPVVSNPKAVYSGTFNSCVIDDTAVQCWGYNMLGVNEVPDFTDISLIEKIVIGEFHACALVDNRVECWGASHINPARYVPELTNPRDLVGNRSASCALDDVGVHCWGGPDDALDIPELTNPQKLYGGIGHHFCAEDDNGLTCWGHNGYDQAPERDQLTQYDNIISVGLGTVYSCVLNDNGIDGKKVTCFGDGGNSDSLSLRGITDGVPSMQNPRELAASAVGACVIDDSGVNCWGDFYRGQNNPPVFDQVNELTSGYYHSCATGNIGEQSNTMRCWGANIREMMTLPQYTNPRKISANDERTCYIDDFGPHCWGRNMKSVYNGFDDFITKDLELPAWQNVTVIESGVYSVCALADGNIECHGLHNWYGELDVPTLQNPTELATGDTFGCAIDDNGVTCWGENDMGQTDVPQLSNPVEVTMGRKYSCAKDDTGIVCWGYYGFGGQPMPLKSQR